MKLLSTAIFVFFLISNPVFAQKAAKANYFDPNPNFKVEIEQIKPFLDEIPEIAKKAEYYQLSKAVLQTIIVVQSNAGKSISDGQFNFARVISNAQNKQYPAFSKAKNGFVICDHRRRGVELTALSMHQIRGGQKKTLSDEKWMQLIFGPGGDLEGLHEPALEIFKIITGKSTSAVLAGNDKATKKEDLPSTEQKPQPKTEPAVKPTAPTKDEAAAPVIAEKTETAKTETSPKPSEPQKESEPVIAEKTESPKPETAAQPSTPAKDPVPVSAGKPAMPKKEKKESVGETVPVPAKKPAKTPEKKADAPKVDASSISDKTDQAVKPATEMEKPAVETAIDTMTKPIKTRRNAVKSNILYPIALGYERAIGNHFSVAVNGFYLPKFAFGDPNASGYGKKALANPSFGFSAEGRYYTSKTKAALTGFYLGGFFTRRNADVSVQKVTVSGATTIDATITVPTGMLMYGGMIGKQIIGKKGFTSDISLGVGPYIFYAIPTIGEDAEEPYKTLSGYTKYKSGIGPRVSISMGYAF